MVLYPLITGTANPSSGMALTLWFSCTGDERITIIWYAFASRCAGNAYICGQCHIHQTWHRIMIRPDGRWTARHICASNPWPYGLTVCQAISYINYICVSVIHLDFINLGHPKHCQSWVPFQQGQLTNWFGEYTSIQHGNILSLGKLT